MLRPFYGVLLFFSFFRYSKLYHHGSRFTLGFMALYYCYFDYDINASVNQAYNNTNKNTQPNSIAVLTKRMNFSGHVSKLFYLVIHLKTKKPGEGFDRGPWENT